MTQVSGLEMKHSVFPQGGAVAEADIQATIWHSYSRLRQEQGVLQLWDRANITVVL